MVQIVWVKKNLRVQDNEILAKLNPDIPTLAVYFFEPSIMGGDDFSDFHLQFIFESLLELQREFYKLSIPLLFLHYEAEEGFNMLKNHYTNIQIFSHEETGNWQTYQRDYNIRKWCKKNDINITEYHSNGVVRKLADRNQWSKIWNIRMSEDIFQPTQIQTQVELSETLSALSKKTKEYYAKYFQKNSTPHLQKGGEGVGKKLLQDFLDGRCRSYRYNISKPFESETSCSRLSPYISYGNISIKYIYQKSRKKGSN